MQPTVPASTAEFRSRLEQRSDILLSTLKKNVEGMGGNLSIIAEFPDRKPVRVASIAMTRPSRKSRKPTRRRRHRKLDLCGSERHRQ